MNFPPKDHRTGTFHRQQEPNGRSLNRELSFKGYLDPEDSYLRSSPKKGRLRDDHEALTVLAKGGMALVLGTNTGNTRTSPIIIQHKTNWRLVISLSAMIIVCYIMTGGSIPWSAFFISNDHQPMFDPDGSSRSNLPGECALNNICRDACGEVMCLRHKLYCGSCAFPQRCGAGGEENVCGCIPATCAILGRTCGLAPDGCGGTLRCGNACAQPSTSPLRFGPRLRASQGGGGGGGRRKGELYRVGYYVNWAQFRAGPSKMEPEELPSHLFSHLYYGFARIDEVSLDIKETAFNDMDPPSTEVRYTEGMWRRFARVAQRGGAVPLLAIGGYDFVNNKGGHKIMSGLVQSAEKRAKFVDKLVRWMVEYSYLGIGWSWDYPSAEDGRGLLSLLRELRSKLNELEKNNGVRYWITVSVSNDWEQTEKAFPDKQALAEVVDWVGVMCYHMYSYQPWLKTKLQPVGSQAPLFSPPGVGSVHIAMDHWRESGFPPEKLVVGVSAAGLLWKLEDETKFVYGSPAVGPGEAPDGSVLMTTAELRAYFVGEGAELDLFHKPTTSVYGHKGRDWVSYESTQSLVLKVDYIVQEGFLGYMFWSVDMDYNNFTLAHAIAGRTGALYPLVERAKAASQ